MASDAGEVTAKGASTPAAQPFLKWAGGKSAIAAHIARLLPRDASSRVYREPFLGGGAMFFYLRPQRAFLSDSVDDLIGAYRMVQSRVELLIKRLAQLAKTHSSEQFYSVRKRFNEERSAPDIDRAAWLIYLNKTCFNGLFRTNKGGDFNVPLGRFVAPRVVDPPKIRLASTALADAKLARQPFEHLLDVARSGDVVYFDPPYDPLSKTSSFAAYADGGFGKDDQRRLAEVFRKLDSRGCLLALSNNDTPRVRELYEGFDIKTIVAPRAISAKAATRGPIREVLVRNVARYPR